MTEAKITAQIMAYLKTLQRTEPVFFLKIHGHAMQRAGIPDMVVIHDGRTMWFEIKRPGGVPTKLQSHEMREIIGAGGVAYVVTSVEEFAVCLSLGTKKMNNDPRLARIEENVQHAMHAMLDSATTWQLSAEVLLDPEPEWCELRDAIQRWIVAMNAEMKMKIGVNVDTNPHGVDDVWGN